MKIQVSEIRSGKGARQGRWGTEMGRELDHLSLGLTLTDQPEQFGR